MTALLRPVMDSCGTVCSGRDCANSDGDNKLASFRRSIFSVTLEGGGGGSAGAVSLLKLLPLLPLCPVSVKTKVRRKRQQESCDTELVKQ